jgi:hypothetical protein
MKILLVVAKLFRADGRTDIDDEFERHLSQFICKYLKTVVKIIFLFLQSRLVFPSYLFNIKRLIPHEGFISHLRQVYKLSV